MKDERANGSSFIQFTFDWDENEWPRLACDLPITAPNAAPLEQNSHIICNHPLANDVESCDCLMSFIQVRISPPKATSRTKILKGCRWNQEQAWERLQCRWAYEYIDAFCPSDLEKLQFYRKSRSLEMILNNFHALKNSSQYGSPPYKKHVIWLHESHQCFTDWLQPLPMWGYEYLFDKHKSFQMRFLMIRELY